MFIFLCLQIAYILLTLVLECFKSHITDIWEYKKKIKVIFSNFLMPISQFIISGNNVNILYLEYARNDSCCFRGVIQAKWNTSKPSKLAGRRVRWWFIVWLTWTSFHYPWLVMLDSETPIHVWFLHFFTYVYSFLWFWALHEIVWFFSMWTSLNCFLKIISAIYTIFKIFSISSIHLEKSTTFNVCWFDTFHSSFSNHSLP